LYTQHYQGEIDLLTLHKANPSRYPFLLESVSVSPLSRYSLLFAYPGKQLILPSENPAFDFLHELDQLIEQEKSMHCKNTNEQESSLPFRGGWFVSLNYELAQQIEPTLKLPKDSLDLPVATAVRVPAAVIVDHLHGGYWVIAEQDQQKAFEQIKQDLNSAACNVEFPQVSVGLVEDDAEKYLEGVTTIREYIAAGDVFQVNFSREWKGQTDKKVTAANLYAQLRQKNPAPFAAYCQFEDWAIISSSPERLVRVQSGIVDTRPIAGTRPRSHDIQKDKALLEELIAHPKERAEHIMLIDLERNDLGRICKPGTVEVDELMVLESYEHVHHIVSNVKGELRTEITPGDVIKAVFPGGTITGCPKVRCMEIIAELEQTGRGCYTGSVGYINHNGDMDFNILIRTLVKKGNEISFRTGAGIVFDSVPEHELKETRHKAKGLLNVFETEA
jgi:anthranilate synthase component 1